MSLVKRQVTFFVSYAHRDGKPNGDLLTRLEEFLRVSKKYDYVLWHDGRILLGQRWLQEILDALDVCDFGLLLVSPGFLSSRFIADVELPRFVGDNCAKPVLPVALGRLLFDLMDTRGLEAHQVFFHRGKCYAQCTNGKDRDDFAQALFEQIEARLDDHFASNPLTRRGPHKQRPAVSDKGAKRG